MRRGGRAGTIAEGKFFPKKKAIAFGFLSKVLLCLINRDQLWTNDGQYKIISPFPTHAYTFPGLYVEPERGCEFPLDLSEYPEPGVGWQNEEGIRIDTQHRLIPKVPKRPALKRGSGGSTSPPGSQHQQGGNGRSEGRGYYTGGPIYEEP